jgi:hypothetical protein
VVSGSWREVPFPIVDFTNLGLVLIEFCAPRGGRGSENRLDAVWWSTKNLVYE